MGPGILSTFGEHLSNIRVSLKCLEKFVVSHNTARRYANTDDQKVLFYLSIRSRNVVLILALSGLNISKVL